MHTPRRTMRLTAPLLACSLLAACTTTRHAGAPHWSYEGSTGPAHWGSLAPEFALCATGTRQSPIDIVDTEPRDLENISFHYEPTPIEILNNGHTIQVNYAAGSYIEVDGHRFDLLQFHFHSPGEHHVHGHHAPIEMHLVHKSSGGALAVVGVFIEEGRHNANFDPIWNNIPITVGPVHTPAATIDADALLPADQRTFRYDGSLTTPPGTEGVRWMVMQEPIHLSSEQIQAFRRVSHGNNRPVQPLNGRVVTADTSR